MLTIASLEKSMQNKSFSRQSVKRSAWQLTRARGAGCLPEWIGWLILAVIILAILKEALSL